MIKCSHCGMDIDDKSKFCSYCGKELMQINNTENKGIPKGSIVGAIVLCGVITFVTIMLGESFVALISEVAFGLIFAFLSNRLIHNQQTVNRALKRILKEYNLEEMKCAEEEDREAILLPNFSCHNLRHTFATRCCENIGNIKVIQSVMGYKDIETTMQVYKCADTPNASMESIGILQGMLGHSDLATTMDIYAEATEEAVNESFSILGNSIVAC